MSAIPEVTTSSFQADVLGSDKPVLVDFWAPWCGPCKMLAPVIEEVAGQLSGQANFVKLNTDENPDIAGKYGISGIPTLILFKGGEAVDRIVGFVPKSAITSMISKHVVAA
jgi:thioredoxin 1